MDNTSNKLNFRITVSKISTALFKLKLGKAYGIDEIPNEMLKAGHGAQRTCITETV